MSSSRNKSLYVVAWIKMLTSSCCRVPCASGVRTRKEGTLAGSGWDARARKHKKPQACPVCPRPFARLPRARVSSGLRLGWVYKKAGEPPLGRPPTHAHLRSIHLPSLSIQPQPNPTQQSRELAASSASKLERAGAGPVRGATAGEGDEIGIDPLPDASSETPEQRNKFLVLRLYEALNARDHAAVQSLLAPDLEWWFHGPPKHQHMMRLLTGGSGSGSGFRFVPRSVDALGAPTSTVIAEGQERGCYWVHAWTVGADGVITQLREYFNTDLTVTRLAAVAASAKCVWQSRRPDSATNSLPGLLLAL